MTDSASANPWLGLNTYKENDRLYGRDREAEEVSDIIENNLLTIIYGRSGIGKSSLLQAGVFPRLRYNDQLPVYIRLEHNSETEYISQIVSKIQNESEKSKTNLICSLDISSIRTLAQLAASVTAQDGFTLIPRNITLVFDQFEELFTLPDKAHRQAMNEFFSQLSEVLNNTDSEHALRIVICLREDYLYFLEQASVNVPSLKRNRYSLQGLTRGQGRDVICLPRKGLVSEELAENILDKIDPEHSDVIAPAILSLFMHELYEKGKGSITQENISLFGDHIISNFYENGMKSVSPVALAFLEDRLVTSDGYRHFISYNDALAHGVTDEELERLKQRRIITIEKGVKGQQLIEFSHDVLCPIVMRNRKERQLNEETERLRAKNKAIKKRQVFIVSLVLIALGLVCVFAGMYLMMKNEREQMLANQSRFVAKEAMELAEKGDYIKAMALVAEVYPKNIKAPERPFTHETYNALRENYESLEMLDHIICKHSGYINCVNSSRDGKFIVTASNDGTAKISDLESKKCIHILRHAGKVYYAGFSPDGKNVVTLSMDNKTRIWSIESGKCILKFDELATEAIFSPDGKLLLSVTGLSANIWDLNKGCCIIELENSNATLSNACFSPDMTFIATACADGSIKIWDVKTGNCIKTLSGHSKSITSLEISPDSKLIISSSWDKTAKLWNVKKGNCQHTFNGDQAIQHVQFNKDGQFVITVSNDCAKIWNVKTGECIGILSNRYSINNAQFLPNGKQVLFFQHGTAQIWDITTRQFIKKIPIDNRSISAFAMRNDNYFCTKSLDNVVLWKLNKDETHSKTIKSKLKPIIHAKNNKNGTQYYWTIMIFDEETGQFNDIHTTDYDTEIIDQAECSPDKKTILTRSINNKYVGVWNIKSQTCNDTLIGHKSTVNSVQFSVDGKLIVTASDDYTSKIWDSKTYKCITTLKGHRAYVNHADFSPDGKLIVSASRDSLAKIWDVKTAKCIATLIGHSNNVTSAQFSPDGKLVATASYDKTVKLWNAETQKCIKTFYGHNDFVHSVQFSPNGKYIISVSRNSIILIWEVTSGQLLCRLYSNCSNAVFSADGKRVIALSYTPKIWNFYEPQELIDMTMKKLNNYTLSEEDRRTYYLE